MTQEEKELLLKDLCARLPYGIKVYCEWNAFKSSRIGEDGVLIGVNYSKRYILFSRSNGLHTKIPFNHIDGIVKPYLRPMSSMTEEEKNYIKNRWCYDDWSDIYDFLNHYKIDAEDADDFIDWFNENMFDYRGLITMGLALEASDGMYKI